MSHGIYEGEDCNRNSCKGIIQTRDVENCSCHSCAPCSACTAPRNYCSVCEWDEMDEPKNEPVPTNYTPSVFKYKTIDDLDSSKIDWISKGHTHFSMIKEGVYPENLTREDVEEEVKGTFGGRFEYFAGGKFKYIAYTD